MTPQEEFVGRFRKQAPDNNDEIDLFLAWLKENGPDEWHRWAIDWNWDHGTELFEWIIAQANCDRGTALSLYYLAKPDFYTRYATIEDIEADPLDHSESITVMTRI